MRVAGMLVALLFVLAACGGTLVSPTEPPATNATSRPSPTTSLESIAQAALSAETNSTCFSGADVLAALPGQEVVDGLVAAAGDSGGWTPDGTGWIGGRDSAVGALGGWVVAADADTAWIIQGSGATAVARELRKAVATSGREVWFPTDVITPCGVVAPAIP